MPQLFRELKRRNVYRVAVTYAAAAFVTLQAAELVFPATTLEGLYDELVVLAFVGFPIALVVAWAFELTPEGVRRTPEAEPSGEGPEPAPPDRSPSRRAPGALVGLGVVAAAGVGAWYLLGAGGEPASRAAGPADTARSAPRAGPRSIAVLPFENMGGEESEQFTRGFHDGLLTRLFNVSGLKVISRTSVLQFRETELPLPAIADSLGVKWVMEGGVQRMGDQLQVNAQLIDPRTDTHAWAQSYRRDLTTEDLFAIQGELTKRIARSLEAELSPAEVERIDRCPTEDMGAYRLYVRGRSQLNSRTSEGMRKALGYFRRAIEQDSGYALAWSGLADALGLAPLYLDSLPTDAPDQETAARRALDLAAGLAEAHASVGYVRFLDRRGPEALLELERAVRLKPSYAQAHHWLGYLLMTMGRLDEAGDHVRLAVELDPGHASARGVLALLYQAEGNPGEALAETRRIDAEVFWRLRAEFPPPDPARPLVGSGQPPLPPARRSSSLGHRLLPRPDGGGVGRFHTGARTAPTVGPERRGRVGRAPAVAIDHVCDNRRSRCGLHGAVPHRRMGPKRGDRSPLLLSRPARSTPGGPSLRGAARRGEPGLGPEPGRQPAGQLGHDLRDAVR